jgi:hypothetical protein
MLTRHAQLEMIAVSSIPVPLIAWLFRPHAVLPVLLLQCVFLHQLFPQLIPALTNAILTLHALQEPSARRLFQAQPSQVPTAPQHLNVTAVAHRLENVL